MPNEFVTPGGEKPPVPYRYQKFPMILYRDGTHKIIKSEEEEAAAFLEGWGTNPAHKSPPPMTEVKNNSGKLLTPTEAGQLGVPYGINPVVIFNKEPAGISEPEDVPRRRGRPRTAKA